MAAHFFTGIGIEKFELKLNSIGCPNCRPKYRQALLEFARGRVDKLCQSCVQRYEQNPMRMLDCKNPDCKALLEDAPKLPDYLCDECSEHFSKVKSYLTALDINYTLDTNLVRGFDYYTKTAFEFVSGELGAQNAIGGGGRYDNMVHEIGGQPTPAMGFGLGLDRLMLTLDSMGIDLPVDSSTTVFITTIGDEAHEAAVKLIAQLRHDGVSADMDYTGRSLKAQMKIADKLGSKYVIILGEDEVKKQLATVRTMATSEQKSVPFAELAQALAS
jgi:histidyl-tRNA synthetase